MKIKRVVTKDRDEESTRRIIKSLIDDGWHYAKMEEHGDGFLLTFFREEDLQECLLEDHSD